MTILRNVLPPSSGSKIKTRKQPVMLAIRFLFGLLFKLEEEAVDFYPATRESHPRRQHSLGFT
jgi:hypothetical protein